MRVAAINVFFAFKEFKQLHLGIYSAIALLIGQLISPYMIETAYASSPARVMVRLDRVQAVTPTGGSVCVRASVTTALTSVTVVFPTTAATDYVVNTTAANWTVTTTPTGNWPSGVTTAAMAGVSTASSVSGKTVVFPVTQTPVLGTYYCFNFSGSSTLTTGSAGLTPSIYGSVATSADTAGVQWTTNIVANDQVALGSTIVPPIFTMSFGANTDSFASSTLSSLSTLLHSTGVTMTTATNGAAGWVMWARSSNLGTSNKQSLKSVAATKQIQSASAVNSAAHTYVGSTEDYGFSVNIPGACTVGGTPTADPAYASAGLTKLGVLADNTGSFFPIASNTAPSSGCTAQLRFEVGIIATTPAANDYTDTLTVVGAGLF